MGIIGTIARLGLVLPALCVGIATAWAKDSKDQRPQGFWGYVNLGAAAIPDYDGSDAYKPEPMFAGRLAYSEYYLDLRGPKLRANVVPAGIVRIGLDAGPVIAYRRGRNNVSNDRVDAMHEIDGDIAVGGFAKIYVGRLLQDKDILALNVEALGGIGPAASGTTVEFGPSYAFFPTEKLRLDFNLSAIYANALYNDTYFGVSTGDARRSGFHTYSPGSGMKSIGFRMDASYQLTDRWGIVGSVGITRLVGVAADSPVVSRAGSPTQGLVAAGLSYRF